MNIALNYSDDIIWHISQYVGVMMNIQPILQTITSPVSKKPSIVNFKGAELHKVINIYEHPDCIYQWKWYFYKLIKAAKKDFGYIENGYFEKIDNSIKNLTVDNISKSITDACDDFLCKCKVKHILANDNNGTSVLLGNTDGYKFIRFVEHENFFSEIGITKPTFDGTSYQYYRNPLCYLDYYSQDEGGNVRTLWHSFGEPIRYSPHGKYAFHTYHFY